MKHFLILTLVAVFGCAPATAQDESRDVVHISYFKCEFPLTDVITQYKEIFLPIRQEQVDAGEISYAAMDTHHYGDEWNVIYVTRGESFEKIEAARLDMFRQVGGIEDFEFTGTCSGHKDNLYHLEAETSREPMEGE